MSGLHFQITCAHLVIENEIAQGLTQRDVAQTYALALRSTAPCDWPAANKAIIDRWSQAGLERIKAAAWSGVWRGKALFPSDEGGAV